MDKPDMENALKKALEMEEKGEDFYKDVSKKCKNPVTRKTFSFLADNELLHIDSIKKFYNSMKEKKEFPSLDLDKLHDKRTSDLKIFSETINNLKEKIKPSDDDKKACEFAMDFENKGYKYYENMLKSVSDPKLTKFLKFLLEEESRHYEGIERLYRYITDSENWFMYEEGSFPQGG